MSESSRERLLAKHRSAAESNLDNSVPTSDDFESESNRVRLAALRSLDPSANLNEELLLRLDSPKLENGALSFDAGNALLRPLQESVNGLAEGVDVDLELVGMSGGSTVLHVRPRVLGEQVGTEHTHVGDQPVDSSAAEPTLRKLIALVNAAESEGDLRPWLRAVEALERLSLALDQFDARLDVTWSGVSGATRSASLSGRGRQYVHNLMQTEPAQEPRTVQGRVTELRESGIVKVKAGFAKNSPAFDVRMDPDQLLQMHLEIGDPVAFAVREVRQVDRLQQAHGVEYFFVSNVARFDTGDSEVTPPE